ncbi:MAG: MFS transporter [Deltaproteobacteria bacterium]|jgi:MFS family permease|nr:MFS transporter [Deltaproteobacteria bacterium]
MNVNLSKKLDPRDRRILLNTCYGHFMSHFNMLVFPALVLPLMARLEMPMAQVLSLSFWMYLLFGLTALFWGLLADRFGARPLLLIYFVGSGFASVAAALWLDTPPMLSLALAALGFFSGIYHPAGLGLISKEMSRVSIGMGYNGMFGNLGLAMAPLLTGIMNWVWGPQAAYLCLGGLNLMGAVLMIVYPMEVSYATAIKEKGDGNGIPGAFLILLAAMMLGGIVYRGATVILPAYFELKTPMLYQWLTAATHGTFSQNLVATTITSAIFLIGVGGQFSGGQCADRYDPGISYLVFFGIAGLAAFWMALARDLMLVGLAVLFFFFLLGMQPIENTLVARFAPKRFHHSAFGAKFVLTFGVGALAVKGVAAIETNYDIETVFICLAGAAAIALGFIGWLIAARAKRGVSEERIVADAQVPPTKA